MKVRNIITIVVGGVAAVALFGLVVAILVGPRLQGKSRVDLAQDDVKAIAYQSFIEWSMQNPRGSCPGDIQELTRLSSDRDPWGMQFRLNCEPTATEMVNIRIVSAGPDKRFDTQDDISAGNY